MENDFRGSFLIRAKAWMTLGEGMLFEGWSEGTDEEYALLLLLLLLFFFFIVAALNETKADVWNRGRKSRRQRVCFMLNWLLKVERWEGPGS
jgi:hypothetical protein